MSSGPAGKCPQRLCLGRNVLGKLEDVKDELLHLYPVRLVWLDPLPLGIHIWDLLLSHVVQ